MNAISLTVNGTAVSASVAPRTHLADFLREHLGLTGTHLGCEQGVCGACTVMIDGKPMRSCIAFAATCDGAEVRTIEGFAGDALMGELREAFSQHHALQCGFCTPGMLVSSHDIVSRLGAISEQEIRAELSGNLCRCTGYVGIVNAVHAVAEGKAAAGVSVAVPDIGSAGAGQGAPIAAKAPPPSVAAPSLAPAAPILGDMGGGSTLSQSVRIAAPVDAVWPALKDMDTLALCLPGAELESFDGTTARGRMVVKFGPIKAGFGGEAQVRFDDATRTGTVSGAGRDGGSGSQVRGEISFALRPEGAGSLLDVTLRYRITGALAQFSRGALVQNVVGHLAEIFAANLASRLGGSGGAPAAAAPVRELSAFALLLGAARAWLKGLWGGRGTGA